MEKALFALLVIVNLAGCQTLGVHDRGIARQIEVKQLLTKAERLYRDGLYAEAQALFEDALEISPDDEQALYRLGNIYFFKRDLERSSEYFEAALIVNPNNPKAHYNLATLHLMQAEKHMKIFVGAVPEEADVSKVRRLLSNLAEFAYGVSPQDSGADAGVSVDKPAVLIEKR